MIKLVAFDLDGTIGDTIPMSLDLIPENLAILTDLDYFCNT